MPIATNQQVQTYADTRVRPRAEALRAMLAACQDDKASIDDVYQACAQANPTWTDTRTDGPPHLAAPSDIIAYNELITSFNSWAAAETNWTLIQKLCVRPAGG